MHDIQVIDSRTALARLMDGNEEYVNSKTGKGNISDEIRVLTHLYGQKPYAIIIACSDSRVIPEKIFMVGIGEIFTIRVAGNVIGNFELGSIEYAAQYLGAKLILVMGHTRCGAVEAAISGRGEGYTRYITDEIQKAIGTQTDPIVCERLNVEHSIQQIKKSALIRRMLKEEGMLIVGANYHTRSGEVVLFD
jgi:carbonic anhydrase